MLSYKWSYGSSRFKLIVKNEQKFSTPRSSSTTEARNSPGGFIPKKYSCLEKDKSSIIQYNLACR